MITFNNNIFKIDTKNTSYIIRISRFNHLLNDYYGTRIENDENYEFSMEKYPTVGGCAITYDKNDHYCLDMYSTEIGSVGKGDYKEPSLIIDNGKDFMLDLIYQSYEINDEHKILDTLPTPHGKLEELVINLKDRYLDIFVSLHYLVDYENDVIARNVIISNKMDNSIYLNKVMSMQLEIVNQDFELTNLYGGWGFEGQKSKITLGRGIFINDSKTGNSSNRHNPFFMLKAKDASYNHGNVYSFNLLYSGNHYGMVERSSFDKVRIQHGINPSCFKYEVKQNEIFESPFAILTFSSNGINGASQNMHGFVSEHILNKAHKNTCAPILINNWEATYMKFKESTLHAIINNAKDLNLEMFVLDDGWFGRRTDDTKGLGDYDVNMKKLHRGLKGISEYTNKKGLKFGLWFEPEMVNENSKLYETHPDWVIRNPYRDMSFGRNQLVLDLSSKEVQDYIIENVNNILDNNNIEYVKWDMNRHISDVSSPFFHGGELPHRYMIGLYRVFNEIINTHPNVFFEGCASGGNRFDLGILSYFDQIWTSDDTDAYERINIQSGIALAYPLRCISNHVSASPSHSVLRHTPIDTRFNVAFFGAFGYELDLSTLHPIEKKAVKKQVAFYKKHRLLVRDGTFYQLKDIKEDGVAMWLVVSKDKKEAVLGYYNSLQRLNPSIDEIRLVGLDENLTYSFDVRPQEHNIHMFGGLINQILPIRVNDRGALVNTICKYKTMSGEKESYKLSGKALMGGALKLNQQWMGTGFNDQVRALGDFGSRLYYIKAIEE